MSFSWLSSIHCLKRLGSKFELAFVIKYRLLPLSIRLWNDTIQFSIEHCTVRRIFCCLLHSSSFSIRYHVIIRAEQRFIEKLSSHKTFRQRFSVLICTTDFRSWFTLQIFCKITFLSIAWQSLSVCRKLIT